MTTHPRTAPERRPAHSSHLKISATGLPARLRRGTSCATALLIAVVLAGHPAALDNGAGHGESLAFRGILDRAMDDIEARNNRMLVEDKRPTMAYARKPALRDCRDARAA